MPLQYSRWTVEYLEAYRATMRGPGGFCPIRNDPHDIMAQERRAAWYAGVQQCKADGREGPPAVEVDFARFTGTNQRHAP